MKNTGSAQPGSLENSTLSIAGRMTLNKTEYSKKDSAKGLMQQVNNDDQFTQLPNITTSYIPVQVKEETAQKKGAKGSTLIKQNKSSRQLQHKKMVVKQIIQYQKPAKHTKQQFAQPHELENIEAIIEQIQQTMDSAKNNAKRSDFRNEVSLVHHSNKKNWQTKGKYSFNKEDAFSKLQDLLLNYNHYDKSEIKPQVKEQRQSNVRKNKNAQRSKRNREYNQISNSFGQKFTNSFDQKVLSSFGLKNNNSQAQKNTSSLGLKNTNSLGQKNPNSLGQNHKSNDKNYENKPSEEKNTQNKIQLLLNTQPQPKLQEHLNLQNVQILEIDWMKLPLILCNVVNDNAAIFLQMKDFPVQQNYLEAITDSLGDVSKYKTYSIFNDGFQGGVSKSMGLMSEQQFRERWAQEWSQEIEEQEDKQILCEFDVQWYRSLVQSTYGNSLEEILIKNIPYDIQTYLSNLRTLNQHKNTNNHTLIQIINRNKVLYAARLIQNALEQKIKKSKGTCVIIGMIGNIDGYIGERMKDIEQSVSEEKGKIDKGQNQQTIAIFIKTHPSTDIQYHQLHTQILDLSIYISQQATSQRYILVKRENKKGRMIGLWVKQVGEESVELQVGEQMDFGRKYYILLD